MEKDNAEGKLCSVNSYDWLRIKPVHEEIIVVLKKYSLNIGEAEHVLRDTQTALKKMKLSELA